MACRASCQASDRVKAQRWFKTTRQPHPIRLDGRLFSVRFANASDLQRGHMEGSLVRTVKNWHCYLEGAADLDKVGWLLSAAYALKIRLEGLNRQYRMLTGKDM